MSIGPDSVVRHGELPTMQVKDTVLFMNVDVSEYLMLSGTARDVWLLIDGQRSVRDIVERLVAEFDVDARTCCQDVTALLNELREVDMVEVVV